MAKAKPEVDRLTRLFDESDRPIYALNANREVVYCNRALADWLGLTRRRIVGRIVEYHSETGAPGQQASALEPAPLTELCPPPAALAGLPTAGTISCIARDGRLVHRRADFMPLGGSSSATDGRRPASSRRSGVLAILSPTDLAPQDLAAELSSDPTADQLHRAVRRFRHRQAAKFALENLIGETSAMGKVRAQVAAAGVSSANVLVCGQPGSGRALVARAIHYQRPTEPGGLVPLDCRVAAEGSLRRALDALRHASETNRTSSTLLLEHLDELPIELQAQLAETLTRQRPAGRIVATCGETPGDFAEEETPADPSGLDAPPDAEADDGQPPGGAVARLHRGLFDLVSTIVIRLPRLVQRLDDLPLLAQSLLEGCNRDNNKQIGSVRADALDLLALYSWPGELAQLREVIVTAHRSCTTHEITPADLPAVIHHARQAAERTRPPVERIVLDDLLGAIEREAIERALAEAGGNKTEAASLLGMTRPRLYRRLVQLGLAAEVESPPQREPEPPPVLDEIRFEPDP